MSRVNRRTFLKQSAAFAGAAFVISAAGHRVLGASERVRIGVSGCGGRGGNHLGEYLGMKDVEVAWVIDPDRKRLGGAANTVEKKSGAKPKAAQDIRKALEDKDLDGVSIATTNVWHTLQTIWAVQAGKDVYVEKPATHNVFEGRIAADLIAKSDRIVQTGTQNRSSGGWARIVEITKSGKLGKLLVSHGFASKGRGSIGFKPVTDPPPELDFDLWLGPAPKQPYHANLVHYNWHWFWDFGNGEIGNQGVHQTDVARWAIPGATHPASVFSIGGRFGYKDQGQTPNTQLTVYTYGDTMVVFEVCGLVGGKKEEGKDESKTARVSNDFVFEAGTIVNNNKFYPKGSDQPAEMPKVDVKLGPGGGPFGNFVAAMRSRKKSDLNAPFLEGHYSAALCHLGNISWRLGKDVEWSKTSKPFGANDYANAQWARLEEHLVKNRGLKLEEMPCRLGRALKFDPVKEKFIDDPEADKLLTREPRKPFDVPEKA